MGWTGAAAASQTAVKNDKHNTQASMSEKDRKDAYQHKYFCQTTMHFLLMSFLQVLTGKNPNFFNVSKC